MWSQQTLKQCGFITAKREHGIRPRSAQCNILEIEILKIRITRSKIHKLFEKSTNLLLNWIHKANQIRPWLLILFHNLSLLNLISLFVNLTFVDYAGCSECIICKRSSSIFSVCPHLTHPISRPSCYVLFFATFIKLLC